jgi:hypothetical protein
VQDCNFADPASMSRPFIVMEYFQATTLEQFVEERGCISWIHLQRIATQIAEAMEAAHKHAILHRDLKPANVLVRKEGDVWRIKIIDFGLAMRKEAIDTSVAARSAGSTILGESIAGTLKYAPPEQMGELKGVRPGTYSDVYAYGKLCYFALFKTTEPKKRQLSAIPDWMAELFDRCTEQELDHRISNFSVVLDSLRSSRADHAATPVDAAPVAASSDEEPEAANEPATAIATKGTATGESELSKLVVDLLERSQGFASEESRSAIDNVCKFYRIAADRAAAVVQATQNRWEAGRGQLAAAPGSEPVWQYYRDNAPQGPITETKLRAMVAAGSLTRDDYVWKSGMDSWATAGSVLYDLGKAVVKATLTIDVAGTNQISQIAEKAFRGYLSLARDGLSGLKPFATDKLCFYLDGTWLGEGPAAGDFSFEASADVGSHSLEVIRMLDGEESDRTTFQLDVPSQGLFRFRFEPGRRVTGGLASSRLTSVHGG